MSPSFPASGVEIVDASRYAVTTHDRCSIPQRSPTIVGSAVDTIVESSDASSITSISDPKIGPMRTAPSRAVPASAVAVTRRVSRQRRLREVDDLPPVEPPRERLHDQLAVAV